MGFVRGQERNRTTLKIHVVGLATLEDVYGIARMPIPYRPKLDFEDGLDCRSADDVFTLLWRYTDPVRLSRWTTANRKLQSGKDHGEKLLDEFYARKVNRIVLEKGKQVPPWLKDALAEWDRDPFNEIHRLEPVRSVPPGINRDDLSYYEAKAWRLVYSYLKTLKWPQRLYVWQPVGTGKDLNKRKSDAERAGETTTKQGSRVPKARYPTPEELEQLRTGKITIDDLPWRQFNTKGRQAAWDANEIGRTER